MSDTIEYKILTTDSITSMEIITQSFLSEGWIPLGGIAINSNSLYQTLIKTKAKISEVNIITESKEAYHKKIVAWKAFFIKEEIEKYKEAYQTLDIQKEINSATLWLYTNASKRKRNFDRFFNNWCMRSQENNFSKIIKSLPIEDL